ncbi:hypothetical protein D3C78_234930 [compost metagenome]
MQEHQPTSGAAEATTNPLTAETTKTCRTCHEELPADAEFFYRSRRSPDGLRSECKVCYSELPSVQKRNQKEQGR